MSRKRVPKWLEAARQREGKSDEKPDWLARVLPRAGVLPKGEADRAIKAGRVAVNGRVAREPLCLVKKGDRVTLDGKAVPLEAPTIVLALHKPAGTLSQPDPRGGRTVFDVLAAELPPELRGYGFHAVGRLDKDTTGLLLFTNDERFVTYATSPETHLAKRYLAEVQGVATEEKVEPLRRGVTLHDGPARPAKVELRAPNAVALTLTEGRFHQVKHMLAAVKLPVTKLHREAVGGLELDVPEGKLRRLTEEEIRQKLGFSA